MQWLAQISVRRPVFASVLILSLAVVGAFAFTTLGVDRYPKVDFPTIIVTTRQPGAAPEQIETEITDRIEEAVNTISGIDELRSVSSEGVSQVVVSFVLEKDVDVAAQEVRDKVNRVLPLLPSTIEQPTVEKFDPDSTPVLTLAVSSARDIRDVTEFADKVLRRQLESVSGVGQVLVLGGRARQVNVWLDAERLRAHTLTVTDVARALQSQNAEIPGGRVEQGPQTITLRTLGRVQSVEEFGDIVVKQTDGHPVQLHDVASVEDGMAEARSLASVDGVGTVILQIRRQSGTNTVEVVKAVKARLAELRPTLPPGYDVRIVRDLSEFIEASIRAVEEHLVLGSILAALVVFVFLWNARSTVIAAVAIPTSIISTFGLIWYMGFTLNSMTMLGLTLAVGIVIDDAIVVLENIWRFIEEKGRPPLEAAIEATREIGLAVLATTLSLVAIFVPVAFMGGIVGRFMKSFGMTMAFAILVSMLVSFTLTPMMSSRWLRRPAGGRPDSKHSPLFAPLDAAYAALLGWALRRRWAVVALAAAVLLSSVPLFAVAKKTFLPEDDQSEFEISLRAPEGTSLEATELLATRIAARVRDLAPEAAYTLVTVADDPAATPNLASIYVRLKPLGERRRSQFAVMQQVRDEVLPAFAHERLRTRVQPVATFGGGGAQNATIQYVIKGPDLATLGRAADALVARARQIEDLVDVDTSQNTGKPEIAVRLDRLKAADLGVRLADAAEALRLLVGGDQVTTYNEGGEQYEVHLRARAADRTTTAGIAGLAVPSARLGAVSLDNLATFDAGTAPSEINRLGRQRQVTVYANVLQGRSQTPGMAALERAFAGLNLGPAYRASFTGRSRELGRAAQNFLLAFGLSLVFMYLILAAQFESWIHPVTILLALPLTLPFALVSIIVTGQSLNIFSALGLLVLFGVVKKNSILQIDHTIQLREAGVPRDEAILRASRDRLRPILMTTIAFVAGMIPLVLSSGVGSATNRAIGFVIIGGQSLVLMLTLIVTPVAYSLFDDAARLRLLGRLRALVPARAAGTLAGALLLAIAAGGPAVAAAPAGSGVRGAASGPRASAPAEGGATLELTLEDAVRRALENNPDVEIVRLDPDVRAAQVGQAESAFVPVVASATGYVDTVTPPSSLFLGEAGVKSNQWFTTLGVRQRLRQGGGTWNVSWDGSRSESTNPFTSFNPTLQSGLLLAFSQPLLRDRRIDAARQQVVIAQRNREISELRFREVVVQTVAAVKRAYWNLKAAAANVAVQQRSLELAEELVRQNKARVDVGQLPPLDLVAAQAEVAQRRELLIRARTQAADAEDRLRRLIVKAGDTDLWRITIVPTDEPPVSGPPVDLDRALEAVLSERLDLQRARKDLDNVNTVVRYLDDQRLPDLRLEASYRPAGLGGVQLIRSGGFPGTIVGSRETGFGSVLEQVFRRDYPAWTVGVTVSYPIGRSYEEAGLARAEVERRQAQARLASLELEAVREVRDAARQIDSARERIEATRAGVELARQRLNAEQKRFEVGMSTSFLVTQAQRDLAEAEVRLLQATLDYQAALVSFEALQQAPALSQGSGLVLSGASVVALPPAAPRGLSSGSGGGVPQ
jgi:HAE1 family hydrophobic/amphiphilic exporter-1